MEDNNQKQPEAEDVNKLQTLKTYSSDMAEAVRQNQGSVIKIALAEQNKREQEKIYKQAGVTNKSKVFLVIGGVVMIAGAIAGSYYLLKNKNTLDTQSTVAPVIESIISSDVNVASSAAKSTNKIDLIGLLDTEENKQEKAGSIKSIFLTTQKNGQAVLLPLNDFLSLAEFTAPDSLIRSLGDKYMVGTYTPDSTVADASSDNAKNKSNLFFIFQTKDYNNAYAGMLTWEKTMLDDMFPIFHIDVSGDNNQLFEKPFQDIIIKNKDARVLYDMKGKPILFYLFTDKNNFVISDSEDAIKEIITRLITKNAKPL